MIFLYFGRLSNNFLLNMSTLYIAHGNLTIQNASIVAILDVTQPFLF